MNDQATAPAKADHADCIFCKIADGQIPARKIHEDGAENPELLGHLMSLCGPLACEQGLQDGFKVQINNGRKGGQEVYHLHIHVLGSK